MIALVVLALLIGGVVLYVMINFTHVTTASYSDDHHQHEAVVQSNHVADHLGEETTGDEANKTPKKNSSSFWMEMDWSDEL